MEPIRSDRTPAKTPEAFTQPELLDSSPIAAAFTQLRRLDGDLPALDMTRHELGEPRATLAAVNQALTNRLADLSISIQRANTSTPEGRRMALANAEKITTLTSAFAQLGETCANDIRALNDFRAKASSALQASTAQDMAIWIRHSLPQILETFPLTAVNILATTATQSPHFGYNIQHEIRRLDPESPARVLFLELLGKQFDAYGEGSTESKDSVCRAISRAVVNMAPETVHPYVEKLDNYLSTRLCDSDQEVRIQAAGTIERLRTANGRSRELNKSWASAVRLVDEISAKTGKLSFKDCVYLESVVQMLGCFHQRLDQTLIEKLELLAIRCRTGTPLRATLIKTFAKAAYETPELDGYISSLLNDTSRNAKYNHCDGCIALGHLDRLTDDQLAQVLSFAKKGINIGRGSKWGSIVYALSSVSTGQPQAEEAVTCLVDLAKRLPKLDDWQSCLDSLQTLADKFVPTAKTALIEYCRGVARGRNDERKLIARALLEELTS